MKDTEQAKNFIEIALNGLEKSVNEDNKMAIQQNTQTFNVLISEYKNMVGRKEVKNYLNNYAEIINGGKYLK